MKKKKICTLHLFFSIVFLFVLFIFSIEEQIRATQKSEFGRVHVKNIVFITTFCPFYPYWPVYAAHICAGLGIWVHEYGSGYMGPGIWVQTDGSVHMGPSIWVLAHGSNLAYLAYGSRVSGPGS